MCWRKAGGARPRAPPTPACLGHDTGLRPEAAARATECFAVIPLCLCCAVAGRTRRLLVRADVGAVQERHAERDAASLSRLEQALPNPEMAPAIEGLRC